MNYETVVKVRNESGPVQRLPQRISQEDLSKAIPKQYHQEYSSGIIESRPMKPNAQVPARLPALPRRPIDHTPFVPGIKNSMIVPKRTQIHTKSPRQASKLSKSKSRPWQAAVQEVEHMYRYRDDAQPGGTAIRHLAADRTDSQRCYSIPGLSRFHSRSPAVGVAASMGVRVERIGYCSRVGRFAGCCIGLLGRAGPSSRCRSKVGDRLCGGDGQLCS
jgi:hypothetical protein